MRKRFLLGIFLSLLLIILLVCLGCVPDKASSSENTTVSLQTLHVDLVELQTKVALLTEQVADMENQLSDMARSEPKGSGDSE